MQKRALILGINGQDGSYLADLLVQDGYDVHGVVRRNSQPNLWRIAHLLDRITIHQGDLLDFGSINRVFWKILPEEIYNEADQDHVGFSEEAPAYSAAITYGAVANLLEMVSQVKTPKVRLFQPLSATMFGDAPAPQTLETKFNPQSPYAIAKLAAHYLCKRYRERYGTFVSTAILYNHDSVRRQGDYLLHRICKSLVNIAHGYQAKLFLSNIEMGVDIGYAGEYMEGVRKLMQLDSPQEILLGMGSSFSISRLVAEALHKTGVHRDDVVEVDSDSNQIPVVALTPDMESTSKLLGWTPTRSPLNLISELCDHYNDTLYGGK